MRSKISVTAVAVLVLALLCSCSGDDKGGGTTSKKAQQVIAIEEGFYQWDSLTFRSAFARIDVVPDLGGKIMGYELSGYQLLWHDPKGEGKLYENEGYGFGESFFNPGGAKVWPSPQGWGGKGQWPGPPDNVLDGSPYEYESDGASVTVTSPEDTGDGRTGLQFKNTYSLRNHSSIVDLNLSMSNVSDSQVKWGLWHLATVPVDRLLTVYVPVRKNDWHVIFGDKDNPQWLGVEDGLFRARYDKQVGKVGMKVREGWAAWHDETNNVVFVMMFPVRKNAEYPDGGSNFEIWTSGSGTFRANGKDFQTEYSPETALMELEVMGPLTQLRPDGSSSMDITWGACICSGVKRVTSHGVVAQEPVVVGNSLQAKFGSFYGGYLQEVYLDKNGKTKGYKNVMEVSPLTEIITDVDIEKIAAYGAGIRYQIQSYAKETPGVMGELMFK